MSALITRASISSVTPGRVATRAPASVARLRAAVCESDCTVGARMTSAAAIASATVPGGSAPCAARSEITVSTASPPASAASALSASPMLLGGGIAYDQHLLALSDAEAVAHDGPHSLLQLAHPEQRIQQTIRVTDR